MSINVKLKKHPKIKSLPISYPVHYSELGVYISDSIGSTVADVRGWGWIQKLPHAEEIQDGIGEFIVDAINEKIERERS